MKITVLARYTKLGDPYIRVRLSDGRVTGEHRFLMERRLNRRLRREEHVHHIDENKRNNKLSNLEVKSASIHCRDHQELAQVVALTCPSCGKAFNRTTRYIRTKKSRGTKNLFCSRRCRVPMYADEMPNHIHGSLSGYNYWVCRCEKCREAKASAHLRRKERLKLQ